jgi:hypothetical protein
MIDSSDETDQFFLFTKYARELVSGSAEQQQHRQHQHHQHQQVFFVFCNFVDVSFSLTYSLNINKQVPSHPNGGDE